MFECPDSVYLPVSAYFVARMASWYQSPDPLVDEDEMLRAQQGTNASKVRHGTYQATTQLNPIALFTVLQRSCQNKQGID